MISIFYKIVVGLHGSIYVGGAFMKNDYKLKDDICEVYCYHKKNMYTVIIDRADFEYVNSYKGRWYIKNDGYAYCIIKTNGEYKGLALHRFLLKPEKEQIVDHINRDKLNNKRSNLRIIPKNKNQQNISIYGNKRNTSGHRNIRIRKQAKGIVYHVEIARKYIGTFKTLEEAILERDKNLKILQPYCFEAIDN